ncbi:MAG: carbohydrate ABC transporter permease, partial [Pseudonocardiaceae bacterium]
MAVAARERLAVADSAHVERTRRRAATRHRLGRVGLYLLALGAALVAALPFIWGTITAFKEDADLYNSANNPFVFNLDPTGEHVSFLFSDTQFLTFAANTLLVGLAVSALTLAVGLPAAYSLARLNMRWSGALGIAIFLVYLVPPTLLFISITRVVAILGLQDSTWSLIVIYPTITIPVSVWLLIGFLKAVPRDLEEQAMVDGYSRLSAFMRIVIPLALPGIVAVVV